jgi:cyclopropane fatty-acyl-phospholipid synthase-like methyltransferase
MNLAEEKLSPASQHAILDIGAGTGRNSLPLAQRGHPVTALELTPEFAKKITGKAEAEGIEVEVVEADVLGETVDVEDGKFSLVVCSEVTTHFRGPHHLRLLFERSAKWLKPGGILLFNAFVSLPGYAADEFARQVGQITWSGFFLPEEIKDSASGLGFIKLSDEAVHSYEKEHQASDYWPPTVWFDDWSRGFDVFGFDEGTVLPPIELRWLSFERTDDAKAEAAIGTAGLPDQAAVKGSSIDSSVSRD